MKHDRFLIAAVLTLTALGAVGRSDDDRPSKKRLKGVELYSWQDKENRWVFVLMNGTNREKSEAEVKGAKDQIKGTADLAKALSRLAVDEYVSWNHRIEGFEYPSKTTREEIQKAAEEAMVHLMIAPEE